MTTENKEITEFYEDKAGVLYKCCKYFLALMCILTILLAGASVFIDIKEAVFFDTCYPLGITYVLTIIIIYSILSYNLYKAIKLSFNKKSIVFWSTLCWIIFYLLSFYSFLMDFAGVWHKFIFKYDYTSPDFYQGIIVLPFELMNFNITVFIMSIMTLHFLFKKKVIVSYQTKFSKKFIFLCYLFMVYLPMILILLTNSDFFISTRCR